MKIVVYGHLRNGGAKKVWELLVNELKKSHIVIDYSSNVTIKFSNLIEYLCYIYIKLPKINRLLANKITEIKPDIILVTHSYLTKSPYLLRYLDKTIYLCHEEPREFYEDSKYLVIGLKSKIINLLRLPLKFIDIINVSSAKIVLANSIFSKNKLSNIYKRNIHILPMPLSIIKSYGKDNIKKQYLTIGSTSIFKGIDFIIKAIALLPDKYRYPLIIIGDLGRDNKYIVRLAKNMGVIVKHFKNIDDIELTKYYKSSTLLLAAAHNEPFGLSLIEALSHGLPVVSVDEGGYSEIIDKKILGYNYGKLTKRNELEFSEAIIDMLNSSGISNKEETINYVTNKYEISKSVKSLNNIMMKL